MALSRNGKGYAKKDGMPSKGLTYEVNFGKYTQAWGMKKSANRARRLHNKRLIREEVQQDT